MNTGDKSQSLDIRTKTAIQHGLRVLGRNGFEMLIFCSAACHMGNFVGFTGDEEVVHRYLGTRLRYNAPSKS